MLLLKYSLIYIYARGQVTRLMRPGMSLTMCGKRQQRSWLNVGKAVFDPRCVFICEHKSDPSTAEVCPGENSGHDNYVEGPDLHASIPDASP